MARQTIGRRFDRRRRLVVARAPLKLRGAQDFGTGTAVRGERGRPARFYACVPDTFGMGIGDLRIIPSALGVANLKLVKLSPFTFLFGVRRWFPSTGALCC